MKLIAEMINYRYCPQCKAPLSRDKEGNHHCNSCGVTIYNNPAPTVGVLPVKNARVLLAKRAIEPYKGKLDTIGGFLENGELPEAAAIREAREETGLVVTVEELLGFYADVYLPGEYTLSTNFVAKLKNSNAKPRPADDVASLHWVSITDPPLKQTGFKNTRAVLLMLKRWYKERQK